MTQENIIISNTHEQVWVLLPWYVNRTLSDEEYSVVKNHLGECITCRGEFKAQQTLHEAIKESSPHELTELMQYSKLMQRIKLEKPASSKRKFSFWNPSLAIAAMLAAVMAIPLSFVLQESTPTLYRTLTSVFEKDTQKNEDNIGDIRVIFEPTINAEAQKKILHSIGGKIIQSADKNGVYLVQILSANDDRNISDAINYLRRNIQVVFVEPAYTNK